jgi:hypothetical protein
MLGLLYYSRQKVKPSHQASSPGGYQQSSGPETQNFGASVRAKFSRSRREWYSAQIRLCFPFLSPYYKYGYAIVSQIQIILPNEVEYKKQ